MDETDGRRVRRLRKRAGLTQKELAARVGRTQGWVSQVETDRTVLDSVSVINTLARALGAHPNAITGRPYPGATPAENRAQSAVAEIRRQVDRYDLPPEWSGPVSSPDALRAKVERISALGQSARYTRIAEAGGALLAELHAATETHQGHERDRVFALLTDAYREIHAACYGLGYEDLASLITRNIRWSAGHSGDPMLVAVAACLRVRDLWLSTSWEDALTILDRALSDVEAEYRAGRPEAIAVTSALHRRAAISAARRYDAPEAWARLDLAREAVGRHPERERGDYYKFTSTPLNVAIYGVAVAVELGNGTEAVKRSADVHLPPAGLAPFRVGHHHMDLGRAWLWHGNRERALEEIERAERVAPQMVRNHPMAHAAVRRLLDQGSRGYSESVRRLAERMHVL